MSRSFEDFFQDPIYLLYKNYLYNFHLRRRVLRKAVEEEKIKRVLEVGCGISPMLKSGGSVVQTDVSWRALGYLKNLKNDLPVRHVACDALRLPFSDASFDGVVCSEVIEHIEDDGRALDEMARVIRPGGALVLTCPIHQKYFDFDDQFVGHYRRYEVPQLFTSLSQRGFLGMEAKPILGSLEKAIMVRATKLFASYAKPREKSRPLGLGVRLLAWLCFPAYLAANFLLAGAILLQLKLVPFEKVVTVCIRCRKRA